MPATEPGVLLAGLGGAALVGGLLLAVAGAVGSREPPAPGPAPAWLARLREAWSRPGMSARERAARRARHTAAAVLGAVVWLAGSWPVAGLITAAVVAAFPALLGGDRAARRLIARLEALESWTRRLADLRIAGGGLEQTLAASARACPGADPRRGGGAGRPAARRLARPGRAARPCGRLGRAGRGSGRRGAAA